MRNRNLISIAERKPNAFRQSVDPTILVGGDALTSKKEKWWNKEDTHLFVLSFTAFFIVFYTFIA